jgi:hypothetical protein
VQATTPICNGGACLVTSEYSGLVLVVSLSEDSGFAPGQTFAVAYDDLLLPANTRNCQSTHGPGVPCTHLPDYGIVQGAYLVSQQNQVACNWDLGNPGTGVFTALPVHVTYRPLWTPPQSSTAVDPATIDLPLLPIAADIVADTSPSRPPGPGQGTSLEFEASIEPALYEATIQPDPPFDAAFPPDVKIVTLASGNQIDSDTLALDTTLEETGSPIIPAFTLTREPGGLVGWSAYLRDLTSLRPLSPIVTLGTNTKNVSLPTNHHPSNGDALSGAELVITPPDGQSIPTFKVQAQGGEFAQAQTYPALAAPIVVSGSVTDVDGSTPVEADLFFEAQSIYVPGETPPLNPSNFEYSAHTTALVDTDTGVASYSLTLPPGQYQLTVRPLDFQHEVTESAFDVDPTSGASTPQVTVDAPRTVVGSAVVADGRPMAGAVVEAVPTACATGSSSVCVPRDVQTTTAPDGTFTMALDPGGYLLRVQPADGTQFPWVTQPLLVGPTPVTVPPVTIPAPVHGSVQLLDPNDNPVVSAIVRVYQVPATGPAVELGRAITDATGTYDMYLAPTSP